MPPFNFTLSYVTTRRTSYVVPKKENDLPSRVARLRVYYVYYVDSLNSSTGLRDASTKRTKQLASRSNKYVDSVKTLGEGVALSVT